MANKISTSKVPDSTNILENLTSIVDSVANVAKMLIKNSVTFFIGARMIKPCLHFMSMLTLRVSIFFITNSLRFPIINLGAKAMPKLTSSLIMIIGSIQAIHDRLEDVNVNKKSRKKIKKLGDFLDNLIFTFSGRGYYEKYDNLMLFDIIRCFAVLKVMPNILFKVSDILSFISNKIIPSLLIIGGIKKKKINGAFNNVSLIIENSVYLLISKRKYGKNIISRIFKLGKTFIMLGVVLVATNAILWFIATKMIPNLKNMKISKRRLKKKFILLFDMLHYAIGMFDEEFEVNGIKSPAYYMSSIPISSIIKFGVKIAIAMSVLFYVSLLLTPIGILGPVVVLGAISVAAVTLIMGFALSKLSNFTVDVTLVKTLTSIISMILTTWAAKKIAQMASDVANLGFSVVEGICIIGISLVSMSLFMNIINSINEGVENTDKLKIILDSMIMILNAWTAATIATMAAGVAALGFSVVEGICIIGISLVSMSLFIRIIDSINKDVPVTAKLKSILNCMTMILSAWASKKIAEMAVGVANMGFKNIIKGIFIIGTSMVMMTFIIKLLNRITENITNTKRLKLIIDSIVMVLTAWAGKKIAQMAIEVANLGPRVLYGILIIGSTLLLFALILRGVNSLLRNKLGILASMLILSFAALIIPIMFFFLALALPMAPFALATSLILLAIAGIFALIGLMWKYVAKGALVTILLGLALDMFAPGFLLFAISAVIIGSHFKEVMLGILALVAVVAIIIGMGFAVELIFMGAIAMTLVGVALMAIALPLLIIASALLILSKVNISDPNGLKNIFNYLGGGLKELSENDAFSIKNLAGAMIKMGMIAMISIDLGIMARVLKNIASLSIPTEFDEKGKGKNYVKMTNQDFIDASINAATIASIFVAMFDQKAASKLGIKGIKTVDLEALKNIKLKTVIRFKELASIVKSVGDMAETIQNVASLRIPMEWDENGKPKKYRQMEKDDFEKASDNVVLITTKLVSILGSEDLKKAVEEFGLIGAATVKRLMESMGGVKDIVDVVTGLAQGSYVTEFDPNTGKPTHWGTFTDLMGNGKSEEITKNIVSIIDTLIKGLKEAFEDDSWLEVKGLQSKCKILTEVGDPLNKLVDSFVKLSEKATTGNLDPETINNLIKSTVKPISDNPDLNSLASQGSIKIIKKIETLDKVVNVVKDLMELDNNKFVGNIDKTVNSTNNFLTKLNSIDQNKLDKMAVISENMQKFSASINGNFDNLAKALSDKLLTAVEQLNLTLDQIKEVLGDVNGALTESTESITKAVESKSVTETSNNNDNSNKKEDPAIRKALEKIQKILSQEGISIRNSLDDPLFVRV